MQKTLLKIELNKAKDELIFYYDNKTEEYKIKKYTKEQSGVLGYIKREVYSGINSRYLIIEDFNAYLRTRARNDKGEIIDGDFRYHIFLGEADFRGTTFSGRADFRGTTFSGRADFLMVKFSGDAYFLNTIFSHESYFGEAKFSNKTYFTNAIFSGNAHFKNVIFSGNAHFKNVIFSHESYFGEAKFSNKTYFTNAIFSGGAFFWKVVFSGNVFFKNATFSGDALFWKAVFSDKADFWEITFSGEADFTDSIFSGEADFAGFSSIKNAVVLSFLHAKFNKRLSLYYNRDSTAGFVLDLSDVAIEPRQFLFNNVLIKKLLKKSATRINEIKKRAKNGKIETAKVEVDVNPTNRITFTILKDALLARNNKIDALEVFKLEMKAKKRESKEDSFGDRVILWFGEKVSQFGTDPLRAIIWWLVVWVCFAFILLTIISLALASEFSMAQMVSVNDSVGYVLSPFSTFTHHDFLDDITPWWYVLIILLNFIKSILLTTIAYEIIKSFRKFGRGL